MGKIIKTIIRILISAAMLTVLPQISGTADACGPSGLSLIHI